MKDRRRKNRPDLPGMNRGSERVISAAVEGVKKRAESETPFNRPVISLPMKGWYLMGASLVYEVGSDNIIDITVHTWEIPENLRLALCETAEKMENCKG